MAKRIMSNSMDKTRIMLGELSPGSVVLDQHGHAWQSDRLYWYRAYGDSSMVSTWELAFQGPFRVVHKGER